MAGSNQETLNSYENNVNHYINRTLHEVSGGVKKWIDLALSDLPTEAKILEFGSAFGRDAAYIISKGYAVECTDATSGFVAHLKEHGFSARLHNAITDPLSDDHDLIIANAVLLHFTRQETALVLAKVFSALKKNGRFAFSLKQGKGESWSDEKIDAPRFFCYWEQKEIESLLENTRFSKWTIDDDGTGHGNAKWLHIIAYKS